MNRLDQDYAAIMRQPRHRYRAWKWRLYYRCEPAVLAIAHLLQRLGLMGRSKIAKTLAIRMIMCYIIYREREVPPESRGDRK